MQIVDQLQKKKKKKKHSGEVKEKHFLLHQQLLSTRPTSDPSGLIDGANKA